MIAMWFAMAAALGGAQTGTTVELSEAVAAGAWVYPVELNLEPLPLMGRWSVQSSDDHCGVAAWSKLPSGSVGMWAVHPPASNDYMLTVFRPGQATAADQPARPSLRLNAATLRRPIETQVFVNRYPRELLEGITMKLERAEMKAVLEARSLAFDLEGESSFRVEIDGKGSMAPLDECERSGLIAAGLDPSLPTKLSQWPTFGAPAWSLFSNDDYPASEMAAGHQGRVQVQLNVDAVGDIEGCKVVKSSGSAVLDLHTCEIFLRRAKLSPALDKAGKPVAAPVLSTVGWRLSE